ncbi:MAG: IS30 family transposase [Gammaproteobacteria bacterium]|nr:IS30 family transposase [Gammaproteobacteria bacterium]
MGHTHLNYLKRCQILALWKAGFNQNQIAKEVGVYKSTISREFRRNLTYVRTSIGYWAYKPDYAQGYADARRKAKRHYYKFTKEVEEFVRTKLLEDWSPEQISGYAKRWELFSISHERIYQFIMEDKQKGGELYKHLRHKNKKYRKRYGSVARYGAIKNRKMIDERPKIVGEKKRIGDWKIDTIIGKNQKQAVLSIVERVSKFTLLRKLKQKTSEMTKAAITDALAEYKKYVHTITSDNGCEFAKHEEVSMELNADFFFAHPYSSWERGLNENTNGLIRQYLKKGSEFTKVTNQDLAIIEDKLNNRPRKTLNYKSPNEIFKR